LLTALLIALGVVLILAGLVGCLLPILPGPPLSFAGLVALWGARGWEAEEFGPTTVLILGVAAAAVTALDYITPVVGAKKFGASKAGVWGSIGGMIVGMIWFPPFGMLVGAFVGAMLGELFAGKESGEATRAAWGVFVGTMVGIVFKLVVSGVITFYFVSEII